MIPDYINCKSEYVVLCDFVTDRDCPGTCAYYSDIGGIGEMDAGLSKIVKLEDEE